MSASAVQLKVSREREYTQNILSKTNSAQNFRNAKKFRSNKNFIITVS